MKFYLVMFILLNATYSLKSIASTAAEIQHLLTFIEMSHCQYERNGSLHSAYDAKQHISKKYHYYQDDIESAEDFIRLTASKSSLSGKPYLIHCRNSKPTKSSEWLLLELKAFRKQKK
ncbi:hypothetical protein JF50_18645 [Pseudoalteromonas luteoviolacea]|uniref:DUF5329 domain-containing protein n=1 Tax=Pseudoalteromonas luteoviolacea TaxID=43657 RepID=A0A0C1QA28_9GAMM|nr:DUF5329 family protein [Pseudoalteromonas luteoviolacea]KID56275.1 hypothetical protein JF50_18645 [Pseudoalteromonas luteoviolacea]